MVLGLKGNFELTAHVVISVIRPIIYHKIQYRHTCLPNFSQKWEQEWEISLILEEAKMKTFMDQLIVFATTYGLKIIGAILILIK